MDWLELLNQVLSIILPAAATLLATWFAFLGSKLKEKINTEVKEQVVKSTVAYVQQVYNTLSGEEKLTEAIDRATSILNEKGIKVSETELRTLIESAVYGLKQGFSSEIVTLPEESKEAE